MTVIRISDLEKTPTGPVWALNSTSGTNRSIISMTIPRDQGGADTVKMPVTWLPVDLTGQVSKRQLLKGSEFRRAVTTGYIRLISEEEAMKAFQQAGAKEEMERLQIEDRVLQSESANMTAGTEAAEAETEMLPPRIIHFIAAMEEASSASSVLNTLRNMGALAEEEYKAIAKAAENKKGFESIVAYCEEGIDNLK